MSDQRQKRLEAWEKVSAKGFWHFVLIRGVFGWGVFMFVFMTGWRWIIADTPLTPEMVAFNAVLWATAGLLWGTLTYKLTQWMVMRKPKDAA